MANSDKNIVITPNISSTTDYAKIVFSGADSSTSAQNITLRAYPTNGGTLSFEGSAGQLMSIANTMSGTIFSANDVSGIPSIEVLDTGLVKLAPYNGQVGISTSTAISGAKLTVTGGVYVNGVVTATTFVGAVTGAASNVTNSATFNNGGVGDSSGITYNGSAARTISYNTIGAPSTTGANASGTWGINITGYATNLSGAGGNYIVSSSAGTAYSTGIQIREKGLGGVQGSAMAYAPMLAFHWSGLVASSIMMEASGRIGIFSNPGTGYENFVANNIYAAAEITAYASDKRLKTDIRPITNAVEKVKLLNGVIYKWNDLAGTHGFDQTKDMAGLFAQDVEAVLPEIIRPAPFDDDGSGNSKSGESYKTVQYEKIVPLLVEAIKEQQLMIEELKSQIQELKIQNK